MPNLIASPTANALIADRDQDLTHVITLPMGTYLTGGASGWALQYTITNQSTGVAVVTKTTGAGIVVTTAGSASADAVFTVTINDTDIDSDHVSARQYNYKLKRTDAGSEVNIDAGTISFRR